MIASVGHHTDRTLLDDVAAVSCSTPTHAAEVAVGLDCAGARTELPHSARSPALAGGQMRSFCVPARSPPPRVLRRRTSPASGRPAASAPARGSGRLAQASFPSASSSSLARRVVVLARKPAPRRSTAAPVGCASAGATAVAHALAGHDPQRTLERGYALVQSEDGAPILTAAAAASFASCAAAAFREMTHSPRGPRAMSCQDADTGPAGRQRFGPHAQSYEAAAARVPENNPSPGLRRGESQ